MTVPSERKVASPASAATPRIASACFALPLTSGVLSPHFGHCEYFAVIRVRDDQVMDMEWLTPPEHVPGKYPLWLAEMNVTDVIAGGIGQRAIELLKQNGIHVYAGGPPKPPKEIVSDWIGGKLQLSVNLCNHDGGGIHGHCMRH